jgi:hypothetical protein
MSRQFEPSDSAGTLWPQEAGGSMRGLRAWLARLVAEAVPAGVEPRAGRQLPRLATSFENRVQRLRADAHAAYRSVEGARGAEGPDAAALEAALAVVEAEWRAALADRDSYAEALKAIRVYAPDPQCRAMAARGLSGAPVTPAAAGAASSGVSRFPFIDEPDD